MESIKDYSEDLNKCSKCGLCQGVCPLFMINKNECAVSKGKFIILHKIALDELNYSKTVKKYLDMCLKCGKCSQFCPSNIDVCKILSVAKHECDINSFQNRCLKFLQSKFVFNNIIKIFAFVFNFPVVLGYLFKKKLKKIPETSKNIIYFKGCINNIFPNTEKYIKKIFKNSKLYIATPNFDCCGLPFLSEGNLERFCDVAKHNLDLITDDYDYFVTDCASCESTILDYKKYLNNNNIILNEKSKNWGDIIVDEGLKFEFKKPTKVTFHKPCHLKNDDFVEKIFENCKNVEYIKMENYDNCCGLAGSFSLKNPDLSLKLIEQKAIDIINTNADIVITTCPACLIGLKLGLLKKRSKIKVKSMLEFLAEGNVLNN